MQDMTPADPRQSLIFGIVAATGTPIQPFIDTLATLLKKYRYEPVPIRLTELLLEHAIEERAQWQDEGQRIQKLMDAGDLLREKTKRGDAMALLGVLGIATKRRELGQRKPCAFVIQQLKHPEEISALQRIYGDRFFTISLYSTYSERLRHLTGLHNLTHEAAKALMKRDEEDERKPMGQRTRDTFELGDVFFRIHDAAGAQTEVERFLDLIFGCPKLSPRLHEHAMYLAYATSFRSADLSRQVGASLTNQYGDIIGVGANDVPSPGGGQYWPGSDDQRDHALGYDSNHQRKLTIAKDVFDRTPSERGSRGASDRRDNHRNARMT